MSKCCRIEDVLDEVQRSTEQEFRPFNHSVQRGSVRDQPIRCIPNTAIPNSIFTTFSSHGRLHQACHAELDKDTCPCQRSEPSAQPSCSTTTSRLPRVSTMTRKSKEPKKSNGVILSLDIAIGLVNIGKEASSMTPAPAVFGVATIILTTIRVSSIPLRERGVPGSVMARTSWPTNKIVSTSEYSAPMFVTPLGGERMERG